MGKISKIAISMALTLGVISTVNTTNVFALEDIGTEINKVYGRDRFVTAVEVSKQGWNNSNWAIITNGYGFSDALCSTPLSKVIDGPILLTQSNKLPESTKNELKRLRVKKVYIVGGTGVVTPAVEREIRNLGINIKRLGGRDRYDTSLLVAKEVDRYSAVEDVLVVPGEEKTQGVDALSSAPLAALNNMPMLLSKQKEVPENIKNWIKQKDPNSTYVIASNKCIDDKAVKDLPRIERVYGKDRYDTNLKVLEKFGFYLEYEHVYVAQGTPPGTIDALTAGPLAAKKASPLILVSDKVLSNQIKYLQGITSKKVLGIGGQVPSEILVRYASVFDDRIATKVKSLTILDRNNIILDFDGIVKKTPAEKISNYEVLGTTITRAKCLDEFNKVQITFKTALTDSKLSTLTGKISNVIGENITIDFARRNLPVIDKVTDKIKPKIKDVTVSDLKEGSSAITAKKKIIIKFDEVVNREDASMMKNFKIVDKNNKEVKIQEIKYNKETGDEVSLITTSVADTTNYILEVKGIRDLSNNIMVPVKKSISLKDNTKPKVIHFELINTSDSNIKYVELTFDKRIDEKTATNKSSYAIKDSGGKSDSKSITDIIFDEDSRDRVRVVINNINFDGECTIEVKGIKDLVGNTMDPYKTNLNFVLDRPSVKLPFRVNPYGATNKMVITVEFDRAMNEKDIKSVRNYIIKRGDLTVPVTEVKYTQDNNKFRAELYTKEFPDEGDYIIQFQNLRDITGVMLDSTPIPLNIAEGMLIRPRVIYPLEIKDLSVDDNKKEISVNFDKKMNPTSIKDTRNYVITCATDGEVIEVLPSIRYQEANGKYQVIFKTNDFKKNGRYSIRIKDAKDTTGVKVKDNEGKDYFTLYDIRPMIQEIKGDEKDPRHLTIIFSQRMDASVGILDNYDLRYNDVDEHGVEKIADITNLSVQGNKVELTTREALKFGMDYTLILKNAYSIDKTEDGESLKVVEKPYRFRYDHIIRPLQ